jgi:L-threonylcarbamoyladenylate synthase
MLRRLTVDEAVSRLQGGGVLAFPTDTSYALGCDALDADAVARVAHAKGRPSGKPLPILLPSVEALRKVHLETPLIVLAEAFWPGPLTLVVPAFPGLPAEVTAGTNMVGVRQSPHPVAAALLSGLGNPIVATSANRTGAPAASTLAECDAAGLLDVDGVVDGGDAPGGHATVVGLFEGDLRIFREGPITEEALRAVWEPARRLR